MRAIICGALMALAITAASAVERDITSQLPHCRAMLDSTRPSFGDANNVAWCARMFSGLRYATDGGSLCIPDSAGPEILSVIARYIEARPQRQHESRLLAIEALFEAWPCRRGQ